MMVDVVRLLARLEAERLAIKSRSDPLRQRIEDLNRQIKEIEGVRLQELDAQIASAVEMIDQGLDKATD